MTQPTARPLPENYRTALRVKQAGLVRPLPTVPGWNPERPLKGFQQTGVAYLLSARRALLADQVGLGKTVQAIGLIALLRTLGKPARTIVVTLPGRPVTQFRDECALYYPELVVETATGANNPGARVDIYAGWWDVLIVSYPILLRDVDMLRQQDFDLVIFDEASVVRHHTTLTHKAAKLLAHRVDRRVLMDATPVQTNLRDMHALMELLEMRVFGPLRAFDDRYLRLSKERRRGRHGQWYEHQQVIGYQNVDEFKDRLDPFVLRRRRSDPEVEVELPPLEVVREWVQLSDADRHAYDLSFREAVGSARTVTRLSSTLHELRQLAARPKVARLRDLVPDLLEDGKVIIFAAYLQTVSDVLQAMRDRGIRAVRYTGEENMAEKGAAIAEFVGGRAQVLVGTSAIERALNLQVARSIVTVDLQYNPQRLVQLYGRVQRIGSEHQSHLVVNLLTEGTVDERIDESVRNRAAVSDYVFDEVSDVFERLGVLELSHLLGLPDPEEETP